MVAFAGLAGQLGQRQPQTGRTFGGAIQLVIPDQYEIERPNNRPINQRVRQRLSNIWNTLRLLGINGAGVLTGDIFDPNVFKQFENLQANENRILVTINGILTSREDAEELTNSINTFNVGTRRVAVWNGTHGLGDFVQIIRNELGPIFPETIADLRAAVQIEIAARALRQKGGGTIYVVAHSQGAGFSSVP